MSPRRDIGLVPSTYIMNNIPRGTSTEDLIRSLESHWHVPSDSQLHIGLSRGILKRTPVLLDSKLDDDLSVTTLEFKDTPRWLRSLNQNPYGFPAKTRLGTIWRGVNMSATDEDGRTAFIRAVIGGGLEYAETLAEFRKTDVKAQDNKGRTALHWACVEQLPELVAFCLSISDLDTGLRDGDGLTAFDISCGGVDESIPGLFYQSMFEMEKRDPDGALLRLLTVTSEPDDGPVFPGEALFGPVVGNKLPLVQALMKAGVNLTARNEEQETALHLAAKNGHAKIVSTLLEHTSRGVKCDVEAATNDGLTALHYAAHRGHKQAVKVLMSEGANRETKDNCGRTAMDHAKESRHLGIQAILDSGAGAAEDQIALHQAAREGYTEVVKELLDRGAEIEARDDSLRTALHLAAANNHHETVRALLVRGAAIEAKQNEGNTALHLAAVCGDSKTVEVLLGQGAAVEARQNEGLTALHFAGAYGHLETVEVLLSWGAAIGARQNKELTVLHIAAAGGHHETVKVLLDRGAMVEAGQNEGLTALHFAAVYGHHETAGVLLGKRALVNVKTKGKELTALHFAAEHGHQETAEMLLGWEASIGASDRDQQNALHFAAGGGHNEMVKMLLDRGAEIEARESKGLTALHVAVAFDHHETVEVLAAARGYHETVKVLLNRGAEIGAGAGAGSKGLTALHFAARHGHPETVRVLLEGGAEKNAKDDSGLTALELTLVDNNAFQSSAADDNMLAVREMLITQESQGLSLNIFSSFMTGLLRI
ncbi:Glycerophosphocholine phosphodiesterase [Maublancomyces gigas]|uniref:Glycerophosphocholine phosphodiesterase n=1 Tax=Discina gigas TaxID=1032678 RepID=A0ABR3G715_9PEZI